MYFDRSIEFSKRTRRENDPRKIVIGRRAQSDDWFDFKTIRFLRIIRHGTISRTLLLKLLQ